MNEQANKILVELLQKAANGIDAAVSFSQAQIPDVVHQLLVWRFTQSLAMFIVALATIPAVLWIIRKQLKKVQVGKYGPGEGYSWDEGKPKYAVTMVWDKDGDISPFSVILCTILAFYGTWLYVTLFSLAWLKIWLAPKLYLLEYAASLIK